MLKFKKAYLWDKYVHPVIVEPKHLPKLVLSVSRIQSKLDQ
jgi:hypothetical protein